MANNSKNKKTNYYNKNAQSNKNKSKKHAKIPLTYKDYTSKVDISKENRWSATAGMVNGNFLKLLLTNILLLLFFLPTIALILKKEIEVLNIASSLRYHNIGISSYFPLVPGQIQALEIVQNKYVYLGIIAFAFIGSLAFSGGFYLIRNFVWSNGVLTTKDFFKGIKNSYLKILFYTLILSTIYIICYYSISLSVYYKATKAGWYFDVAKVSAIIIMFISSLIYLYCCSFTVTYKLPLFKTIGLSFRFTFNFFIPNLFFALFCIAPFFLIKFTGFSGFGSLITMIIIFIGIIFAFLTWTSYSQYVFDKIFEGKVDESIKLKQEKTKKSRSKTRQTEFVKPVNDNVEIEQLPEMFSRKDLQKLEESKQHMREDSDKYYQEKKDKKENGQGNE